MTENKVTFGLKNVHYAKITETDGTITYDTPKRILGGVEISLEPRGELSEFYADDMVFYGASSNQGYDGSLSVANLPESFFTEILGDEMDETDLVIHENSESKTSRFALLFEFDGDVKAVRHVLYVCEASRPTVGSETKTNTAEPFVTELTFVSSPRPSDMRVKTKTSSKTPADIYDGWYTAVYSK